MIPKDPIELAFYFAGFLLLFLPILTIYLTDRKRGTSRLSLLFNLFVFCAAAFGPAIGLINGDSAYESVVLLGPIISYVPLLFLLANIVGRLAELGLRRWWALLFFFPVINLFLISYLVIKPTGAEAQKISETTGSIKEDIAKPASKEMFIAAARVKEDLRHHSEGTGDKQGWGSVNPLVWLIAGVMCAIAILPFPYGFYVFLRICIFAAMAYFIYFEHKLKGTVTNWVIGFTIFAILYNPLVPLSLGREIWTIVNLVTIGALAAHYKITRWSKASA
ncbi:MAG: DUF6804 family protein [Sneathiella sp.]